MGAEGSLGQGKKLLADSQLTADLGTPPQKKVVRPRAEESPECVQNEIQKKVKETQVQEIHQKKEQKSIKEQKEPQIPTSRASETERMVEDGEQPLVWRSGAKQLTVGMMVTG